MPGMYLRHKLSVCVWFVRMGQVSLLLYRTDAIHLSGTGPASSTVNSGRKRPPPLQQLQPDEGGDLHIESELVSRNIRPRVAVPPTSFGEESVSLTASAETAGGNADAAAAQGK